MQQDEQTTKRYKELQQKHVRDWTVDDRRFAFLLMKRQLEDRKQD